MVNVVGEREVVPLRLGEVVVFNAATEEVYVGVSSFFLLGEFVSAGEEYIGTLDQMSFFVHQCWRRAREEGKFVHAIVDDGARREEIDRPGELHGAVIPKKWGAKGVRIWDGLDSISQGVTLLGLQLFRSGISGDMEGCGPDVFLRSSKFQARLSTVGQVAIGFFEK